LKRMKTLRTSITVVLMVTLMIGSMFAETWGNPGISYANSDQITQLQKEVAELKKKQKAAQAAVNQIGGQITSLEKEGKKLHNELLVLDTLITETKLKIEEKEKDIEVTEEKAYQAALELKAAEERVAVQEELLKTRVRSMYESGGEISYLEVLLGSSNFGEFLERLDFLSMIVQQDQKIVEDFISQKELVIQKKLEIEDFLVQLEGQLGELNQLQADQEAQEKKKTIRIAEIDRTKEELVRLEEEEAQNAINLANQATAKTKEIEALKFDGEFTWPVPDSYRITSHFGLRVDPFTGSRSGHNGTDIGAPQGTKIVAASGGIVVLAEYVRGYGNAVIIDHGNNVRTLYGHIRNGGIKVKLNDSVLKGQKIAEVGSTGRSTGPHLHFEVHENGKQTDPMKYLKN
jgi:murein DD-endopeptidase MepM/ murein hydrolase activator NlpD